jgi:hypothetical protein
MLSRQHCDLIFFSALENKISTDIEMPLARRFIKADIAEQFINCWKLKITYSYYSLYTFEEIFMCSSLKSAKDKLVIERCGDCLRITNNNNLNHALLDESESPSNTHLQSAECKNGL